MAGSGRTFVDTNVLVYAHDSSEAVKQPLAQARLDALWTDGAGTLSTQVLQEFYSVVTRKLAKPMSRAEARDVVDAYSAWPVVQISPTIILAAARLEERHQLSFWDALLIEAARVAGADLLLTEDMQDGQTIEGVLIENPFAT